MINPSSYAEPRTRDGDTAKPETRPNPANNIDGTQVRNQDSPASQSG